MVVRSPTASLSGSGQLLAFEVSSSVYALPIESVLEVAEADHATCVPGIQIDVAGVMNWHGDPLPVVSSTHLLASENSATLDGEAEGSVLRDQVLVLSDRIDESARLGMPVDRVVGLVEGQATTARATSLVVERRPVDGRIVTVLDPGLLVSRAGEIIQRAAE